ncbi:MAG: DNA primase [Dehalococcoidales bacterium]|nr:MAG: DNA primase [Dehalococcoidales bacterium]
MSVIDEVKQKLDIVEVVSQYVTLTKAGRNFKARCPFHEERTPSFFVFPERQSWHCFGACGTGGDVFSFVMKQQGMDFGEALRLLAQQAGVTVPSRIERDTRKDERERLYQVNEATAKFFQDQLLHSTTAAKAQDYLSGRAFTTDTVSAFQLGFSPDSYEALKGHLQERGFSEKEVLDAGLLVEADDGRTRDRFRGRLMFPIHDARGHTTGFGARALDDSLPKYTNSPQTLVFDKSGTLYAIDLAATAIRKQDRVIIVEGYMDVITAHQNGFTNVVASMGTSITEEQPKDSWRTFNEPRKPAGIETGDIESERTKNISTRQINTIRRLTRNVILALDADTAGEEAMLRCVDYENILDAEIRVILLPDGNDPDDVIREDPQKWQGLLSDAVPVVDFTFSTKTARLDMTTAGDQSRAVHELAAIIARMKDAVRRDHYIRRLEILTKTRYNIIEGIVKEYMAPSRQSKPKREPTTTQATQLLISNPLEEYCLRLLLHYPELINMSEGLLPEYFQDSQNREIFITWQQVKDLSLLKDNLDPTLWEQLDSLISLDVIDNKVDDKLANVVLRLREQYLRGQKEERAAVLAAAAEEEGIGAKLDEEDIEGNNRLLEIFKEKGRDHRSRKGWT